jgi:hypothetical protein
MWYIDAKIAARRAQEPGIIAREQLRDTMLGQDEKYQTKDDDGGTQRLTTD